MSGAEARAERALNRAREKSLGQREAELKKLRERGDFIPELEYFASLYDDPGAEAVGGRTGLRPCAVLCLQAPVEVFLAQGFFPVKVYSGSYAEAALAGSRLPALMCPAIKGVMGALELDPGLANIPWVIPVTCDWMARFRETRTFFGGFGAEVLELEVPRLKESPRAAGLWLAEIYGLAGFLRSRGGLKLRRSALADSIRLVERVRRALSELTLLRRRGLIAGVWHAFVASAFFLDHTERYTKSLEALAEAAAGGAMAGGGGKAAESLKSGESGKSGAGGKSVERPPENGVFLTGSPVYFPNFKIFSLLEEAGLEALGDDLCSSERLLPRHIETGDKSLGGLLASLAETYHQGCLCPVFADSKRRAAIIREAALSSSVRGVVFHLLKGCHPYDLDSFLLEEAVRGWGFKFLKIETDYSYEDSRNLLTRLEAFLPTLGAERA
jgi:benzoyl-CoA reductase/2-hydroxyglutaryl-CoA dehydratase subunit BcrC/BadD/HgdB